MEQLSYISTVHPDVDETDVAEIVDVARYRNRAEGVTGLLLFNTRNFLQVLEGKPASLDAIMRSILGDARHFGVVLLGRSTIDRRAFDDWSMGYSRLERLAGVSAAGDFTLSADALRTHLPDTLPAVLRAQMLRFPAMATGSARPAGAAAG